MLPLLFTVYINDLLVQLSHSGHGCSIGRCCVGAVSYADDICIMSASASGLQSLLDICFAFAESNDLMFNHKKTKCMRFVTGACSGCVIFLFLNCILVTLYWSLSTSVLTWVM